MGKEAIEEKGKEINTQVSHPKIRKIAFADALFLGSFILSTMVSKAYASGKQIYLG